MFVAAHALKKKKRLMIIIVLLGLTHGDPITLHVWRSKPQKVLEWMKSQQRTATLAYTG